MLKKTLFFTLFFCGFILTCSSQNWEQIQNFPGSARDDGSSFTIGEKVYCGLGMDAGFNCNRDFYIFDGASLNWTTSESMPTGEERQYANGFSWNGKGYIFGGIAGNGSFLNDIWIYDPLLISWAIGTPLPGEGRAGAVHFILQDTLYIVGGKNSLGISSDVWALDLTTNLWSQKTALPGNGIWRGLGFARNGLGYVGLGKNDLNGQTEFNSGIYSYAPLIDNWSLLPDIGLSPRCYSATSQKDSLIMVFGGLDPSNVLLNSFDRINIDLWTLTPMQNFPSTPRKGGMSFLVNDEFYISTGVSQTARLNETWKIAQVLEIEESNGPKAVLFPNPCSSKCTIKLNEKFSGKVYLTSIEGRIINTFILKDQQVIEIDLDNIEEGIYTINIGNIGKRIEILR